MIEYIFVFTVIMLYLLKFSTSKVLLFSVANVEGISDLHRLYPFIHLEDCFKFNIEM
jgi:hypothetical protein